MARENIADDWKVTIPEPMADPPAQRTVRKRLDAYLIETLAPALNEVN